MNSPLKPQMNPPQLMPWLAAKAGLPLPLSGLLWQEACLDAAYYAEPGTSRFFALAVDRLVEMITEESLRRDAASLGFRPWARAQARLIGATIGLIDSWQQVGQRSLLALKSLH